MEGCGTRTTPARLGDEYVATPKIFEGRTKVIKLVIPRYTLCVNSDFRA